MNTNSDSTTPAGPAGVATEGAKLIAEAINNQTQVLIALHSLMADILPAVQKIANEGEEMNKILRLDIVDKLYHIAGTIART